MADDSISLYLVTPIIARAEDFAPILTATLAEADVACVSFRLGNGGESDNARIASRLLRLLRAAARRRFSPMRASRAGPTRTAFTCSGRARRFWLRSTTLSRA